MILTTLAIKAIKLSKHNKKVNNFDFPLKAQSYQLKSFYWKNPDLVPMDIVFKCMSGASNDYKKHEILTFKICRKIKTHKTPSIYHLNSSFSLEQAHPGIQTRVSSPQHVVSLTSDPQEQSPEWG